MYRSSTEIRLTEELYNKWVDSFIAKIKRLERDDSFVRDDSFHGIHSNCHMMYKLKCDDKENTRILSSDGHRAYEFLVEFDTKTPEYGIYYGCRALILEGNQKEEIDKLTAEWAAIKEEVRSVLNSTFVNINFVPERFQPTNNANDMTYWTFWITLYPEEDIIEVAALAVKLIKEIYTRFLVSGKPGLFNTRIKKSIDTGVTRYTEKAYRDVLKKIKGKHNRESFERFLDRATSDDIAILEVDSRYEKCWKVKDMSNDEFAFVLVEFCNSYELINSKGDTRWELFTPIIISDTCGPLDDFRKSYQRYTVDGSVEAERYEDMMNKARAIINKMFPLKSPCD